MKQLKFWIFGFLILGALAGAGYGWWALDLRYRPHTIKTHQAEIAQLLETSGYVSPALQGPKLYMISFRSCPDCIRFKAEEFPKLHAAGVDTRVIVIARADYKGLAKSTPLERATVAELWINRRWSLLEQWMESPIESWNAPGVVAADGDLARTAVIEVGRSLVDKLGPMLKDNGFEDARMRYPTLIWWTKSGEMRGCACEKRETYRHVRAELGLEP